MDENATELDTCNDNSGKYKVEAIWDSAVYRQKSESGHLSRFYYLVSWKGYLEEENTWKPYLAVQHLKKLINLFYKDHPDKSIATFKAIDTVSPMAKPTIKPVTYTV